MKLSQLRYFQTACRLGSITRAAEKLHISQPSVSAAIKELEQEFGVTLFSRHYRGFTLTREGLAFLSQAELLLDQADKCSEIMKDIGRKRNLIRLGVPPMIGSLMLPRVYESFSSEHPHTLLRIYEEGQRELLRKIISDELDLAFIPHEGPPGSEFKYLGIGSVETVYCVHKGHPLSGKGSISLKELSGEHIVMFKDSFFQNELLNRRFKEEGLRLSPALTTGQLSTLTSLISGGSVSGFLFRPLLESYPELCGLSLDPPLLTDISLVWKKDGFMFSDMHSFIDCVSRLF